jgi:hypothetical protein
MSALSKTTVYDDAEKPEAAVPVTSECALADAFNQGAGLLSRSHPNNAELSLDVFFGRGWTMRQEETFGSWANDATGYSYEDEAR